MSTESATESQIDKLQSELTAARGQVQKAEADRDAYAEAAERYSDLYESIRTTQVEADTVLRSKELVLPSVGVVSPWLDLLMRYTSRKFLYPVILAAFDVWVVSQGVEISPQLLLSLHGLVGLVVILEGVRDIFETKK